MTVIDADDNREIIAMILQRLKTGHKDYGHGFRINDDTRQYGTEKDSWVEMGLEEAIDLSLYLCAALLRLRQEREESSEK